MAETGNVAAMREALEAINCIDTRMLKRLLCELVEADILDYGIINRTISAVEKARRALSAPARNCDRFQTVNEAFLACHADRGYLSNPIDERRSTISFMLSCEPGSAQETAEDDCDTR